jgi:hypothetical protein
MLGNTYKDKITGFQGVAVAHVTYLTGCDQLCLQPPAEGNDFKSSYYFDVGRLELVSEGTVSPSDVAGEESGCDVPPPPSVYTSGVC